MVGTELMEISASVASLMAATVIANTPKAEEGETVPLDAEIILLTIHMILLLWFMRRFIQNQTEQLIPFTSRCGDILIAASWGFGCNYGITFRHVFGGMQCVLYEFLIFVNPAFVVGPGIVFALELLCELQYTEGGKHRKVILNFLPTPEKIRRWGFAIIVGIVVIHMIIGGVFMLAFKDIELEAWSLSCELSIESTALAILFCVHMLFLLTAALCHWSTCPDRLKVAIWNIRLLILWDGLTLGPFLLLNMVDTSTFYNFESNFFSVEVFGMFFNMGPVIIQMIVSQLHALYIDGGTIFYIFTIQGSKNKKLQAAMKQMASQHHKDEDDEDNEGGENTTGRSRTVVSMIHMVSGKGKDPRMVTPIEFQESLTAINPAGRDLMFSTLVLRNFIACSSDDVFRHSRILAVCISLSNHLDAHIKHGAILNHSQELTSQLTSLRDDYDVKSIAEVTNLAALRPEQVRRIINELCYKLVVLVHDITPPSDSDPYRDDNSKDRFTRLREEHGDGEEI